MADQQYCLRWNNHQPNFISVFKSLLDLEELVDVTLSVEGKHIKAHKVILSACSPYFKLLFTVTPCKHPIVILSDIKYMDLKMIIEFMYCGEINVFDEQLADILDVAEALQVRGLCDPNKKTGNSSSDKNEPPVKKKKRKSEMVGLNNVHQSDVMSQSRFENVSPADTGTVGMFNPKDWLGVDKASHDKNVYVGEIHPVISHENYESSQNGNVRESKNYKGLFNHSVSNSSPQITTVSRPSTYVKRRNIKVQESENFLLALEAVRSGTLGFCKAAKIYGLNNRTLWLEYKKRGYPSTRPPVALRQKSNALSAHSS